MSPRLVPSLWACSNVGLSAGFDLALLVTRIAEVLMPSSGTHLESPCVYRSRVTDVSLYPSALASHPYKLHIDLYKGRQLSLACEHPEVIRPYVIHMSCPSLASIWFLKQSPNCLPDLVLLLPPVYTIHPRQSGQREKERTMKSFYTEFRLCSKSNGPPLLSSIPHHILSHRANSYLISLQISVSVFLPVEALPHPYFSMLQLCRMLT